MILMSSKVRLYRICDLREGLLRLSFLLPQLLYVGVDFIRLLPHLCGSKRINEKFDRVIFYNLRFRTYKE